MTIDYNIDGFKYLTDDTTAITSETKFLLTAQNRKYFENLETEPTYITPLELIEFWNLQTLKVVGVTGTNGKTTVTAAIYSFLLDLGEKPALMGTRGFFVNDKIYDNPFDFTYFVCHENSKAKRGQLFHYGSEFSRH